MQGRGKGKSVIGAHSLQEFVSKLKRPRKCLLMVKAGSTVDEFIEKLVPLLEQGSMYYLFSLLILYLGDIIMDGGNSHFLDTNRRTKYLESRGFLFIGTGTLASRFFVIPSELFRSSGVSGGEEGALNGPSIMPGGSIRAWDSVRPILQAIAARVEDGTPCCDWVGEGGAGHFVCDVSFTFTTNTTAHNTTHSLFCCCAYR